MEQFVNPRQLIWLVHRHRESVINQLTMPERQSDIKEVGKFKATASLNCIFIKAVSNIALPSFHYRRKLSQQSLQFAEDSEKFYPEPTEKLPSVRMRLEKTARLCFQFSFLAAIFPGTTEAAKARGRP